LQRGWAQVDAHRETRELKRFSQPPDTDVWPIHWIDLQAEESRAYITLAHLIEGLIPEGSLATSCRVNSLAFLQPFTISEEMSWFTTQQTVPTYCVREVVGDFTRIYVSLN
jgi:hypothetical protein